jgi:transcriptional regulatory protein LevR
MASIAHFKKILKHDFFEKIKCISDFISTQELMNATTKVNYHWRDRIWTPAQTIWTFLIQVLHHESNTDRSF